MSMKTLSPILKLLLVLLLTSCAVDYKVIPDVSCNASTGIRINSEDSIKFRFFNDVLASSGNKHLIRWAKRHNYQAIGLEVTNLSGKFRKGFQLKYYADEKRIVPVNNIWFAKKARQKMSGAPFIAIPFIILEEAIFSHDDYPKDANGFEFYPEYNSSITCSVVESDKKRRQRANAKLLADLKELDLSYRVLSAGKPVYGIVIFENNTTPEGLTIRIQ